MCFQKQCVMFSVGQFTLGVFSIAKQKSDLGDATCSRQRYTHPKLRMHLKEDRAWDEMLECRNSPHDPNILRFSN